jgi:hypothetical protein
MSLIFEYPYWFILFCILIGLLFASILYARKKFIFHEQENPLLKKILFFLRFLSTSLIAFLLLSPLIKTKSTKEIIPTIVVLQDNSASLKHTFNKNNLSNYQDRIEKLVEQLQNKHNVKVYTFGDDIQAFSQLNLNENQTNIEQAIDQAFAMHEHQHIAAIVLATDGIYNAGINPVYHPLAMNKPIYTIGLGDTTIQKDAAIKNLSYPEFVYLNDNFSLQIDISAQKLKGQNTTLEVLDNNNKVVLQQNISIQDDNFVYSANVVGSANKPGILAYKVKLKLLSGEIIKENNYDVAYVEVIDGRQKILLLYDVPHPDVKAIRQTIEQNKNYQIDVVQSNSFNQQFNDYDLVILHGVPSTQNLISSSTLQTLATSQKSIWYILSAQSNLQVFNSIQNNLQINGSATNGNDVQVIYQPTFSKFILDEQDLKVLQQLPPLLAPFGKYNLKSNADNLFLQRIGNVNTQNPLFLFVEEQGKKTGILAAEGLWRWKLNEYAMNKNTNATDNLINKTVQYLTVKSDKRRFKLSSDKNIYNNNDNILLDAQLYNESFVLVNESEVNVKIVDEQNKVYNFSMDKTLNAYALNVGALPVGNYNAIAKTNYKGKNYENTIRFSVRAVALEYTQTQADFSLLNNLSMQSGGKFYLPKDIEKMAKDIEENHQIKTILEEHTSTKPLIDWKLFFGVIVLLLAAEWFIRKYNGIV